MVHSIIELNQIFEGLGTGERGATLHTYVVDNSPEIDMACLRPSILICPGGGYRVTSDREAEPIALKLMAEGYNAFVLRYSVAPTRYPQQLLEVSAALTYIRRMQKEWHVDAEKIVVCGFSAGGHLAGSLGVLWNEDFIQEKLGITYGENKPNGMLLAYPVITSGEYAHNGSFDNLLGEEATVEERAKLSLEKLVGEHTPPTFLWHTGEDSCVPLENTLYFAMALRENHIPLELHIYPKGGHGLSLCEKLTAVPGRDDLINPHAGTWFKLAIEWIEKMV